MAIKAHELNYKRFIVPKENAAEGGAVDGIEVIGVSDIDEVIRFLNKDIVIDPRMVDVEELLYRICCSSLHQSS